MAKISDKEIQFIKSQGLKGTKKNNTLRCPDPVHKGREVPASEFGKGGNNGRQGYCKKCRARKAREKYRALKQEKKKTQKAKRIKKPKQASPASMNLINPLMPKKPLAVLATAIGITETFIICKKCGKGKLKTNKYWQSNGRGGYRQPCKECLKSKTKISEKY